MDAAVRNMTTWGRVSLADALTMASTVPARLLGLDELGSIAPGNRPIWSCSTPTLQVEETWVAGKGLFPKLTLCVNVDDGRWNCRRAGLACTAS